jgi:hypothetical protein
VRYVRIWYGFLTFELWTHFGRCSRRLNTLRVPMPVSRWSPLRFCTSTSIRCVRHLYAWQRAPRTCLYQSKKHLFNSYHLFRWYSSTRLSHADFASYNLRHHLITFSRLSSDISTNSLYRRLLRSHRHLPAEMRFMGDAYIKSEYRLTRSTDNPLHIIGFLSQWKQYLDELDASRAAGNGEPWKGRKLEMEKLEVMSKEQVGQLYELMHATKEVWKT